MLNISLVIWVRVLPLSLFLCPGVPLINAHKILDILHLFFGLTCVRTHPFARPVLHLIECAAMDTSRVLIVYHSQICHYLVYPTLATGNALILEFMVVIIYKMGIIISLSSKILFIYLFI